MWENSRHREYVYARLLLPSSSQSPKVERGDGCCFLSLLLLRLVHGEILVEDGRHIKYWWFWRQRTIPVASPSNARAIFTCLFYTTSSYQSPSTNPYTRTHSTMCEKRYQCFHPSFHGEVSKRTMKRLLSYTMQKKSFAGLSCWMYSIYMPVIELWTHWIRKWFRFMNISEVHSDRQLFFYLGSWISHWALSLYCILLIYNSISSHCVPHSLGISFGHDSYEYSFLKLNNHTKYEVTT